MATADARKKIWGWWFFDWASQPYNTLLITFIFGPYVVSVVGDGSEAQAIWGYGIGLAGLFIALASPVLGSIADNSGVRMPFIWVFSLMYVIGAWGLWWSAPDTFDVVQVMVFFAIGLIGMEFATNFANAMLPDLAPREELGRLSGTGWAFGYLGGLVSLIILLVFFADDGGKTMVGLTPAFGLDPDQREGTRAVGPLTAIWYVVFMVPFFLWVREPRVAKMSVAEAARRAFPDTWGTVRRLPQTPSLFAWLGASMFSRDGLNGMYTFGGIYAAGVLGWSVTQVGIFAIAAIIAGAIFAYLGGRADERFGPKPVFAVSVVSLILVAIGVVTLSRTSVLGFAVADGSSAPDIAFYVLGSLIGAAGGVLQSTGRTMMVRQADPERMTEAFGLYALSGKAMSWMAPLSIGIVTDITGSQQLGITPLIALFLIGLFLLRWVKPDGDTAR